MLEDSSRTLVRTGGKAVGHVKSCSACHPPAYDPWMHVGLCPRGTTLIRAWRRAEIAFYEDLFELKEAG